MTKADLKNLAATGSFAELGTVFRSIRKQRKISQYELQNLSKIDQGAISRMENGKMNITLGKLQALLNALHAEVDINISLKETFPQKSN